MAAIQFVPFDALSGLTLASHTYTCSRIGAHTWDNTQPLQSVTVSACNKTQSALRPGPWFKIKMSFFRYRKSHCGDKMIVRSSYLHNGISYTGKMSFLYWIGAQLMNITKRSRDYVYGILQYQVLRIKKLFQSETIWEEWYKGNFWTMYKTKI